MNYEIREHHIDDPLIPKLFLQSWRRAEVQPLGCVLITHGISEHSECYAHVAKALADRGWWAFAWDLQGHGKSQGARGYIKDFNDFRRDLKSVINKVQVATQFSSAQTHLVGHSMGGLITLHALSMEHPPSVRSAVLSSPALGLALKVPYIKHWASEFLDSIWPTLTLDNEVRYDKLSHDPAKVESYSKDPLRHNKISPPLYLGMRKAMEEVLAHYNQIQVPLFFQLSGDDQIVSTQASLDLFKKIKTPKQLKIYEESYHEIYNDLRQQEAIADLCNFLGEFSK